jgi:uncharacterized protein (TIGR03083 family)
MSAARDPDRPARLLAVERESLLPVLRSVQETEFGRPTACPGWSVRDVLAHCAAALNRVVANDLNAFTPELNQVDVDARRDWPLPRVLAELDTGYQQAGPVIAQAGGRLDPIALGEWLHGGDVREALGLPLAYASTGFEDACVLLADWSRRRRAPLVEASLPDGRTLLLGGPTADRPPARLVTGGATLMRLFAGRPADPADYELTGATADELVVF